MTEILLVRHAESYANLRQFAAFGNMKSPLTETGVRQAIGLRDEFREEYGIDPQLYDKPVVASEYVRPQQTAELAGFRKVHIDPIINESEVPRELVGGRLLIAKHAAERWMPDEDREKARQFIEAVRSGERDYEVFFTHGMFIASILLELETVTPDFPHVFDDKRGFIPLQASITPVTI